MAQAKSTSLNDQIFEHFRGAKSQLKGLPPARGSSKDSSSHRSSHHGGLLQEISTSS